MAKVHVYIREQVATDSDEQAQSVVDAVEALKAAVEATGADWHGSVAVDPPDGAPVETSDEDVLDGTVPEVAAAVATMTDPAALKALRSKETKGKDRAGALEAIDARLAELKG